MSKGQAQKDTLNKVDIVEAHKRRKRPLWRRGLRLLFRTVFFFILLFGLLRILISFPLVQNKLINYTTNYFSEELNTVVDIGRIDIAFWKDLVLEDFYVEDQFQDTLLFAQNLTINFNTVALLGQQVEAEDITLSNVQFNLYHPGGNESNNLAFLNDYFATPNKPKKTPPDWLIAVKNIYLHDLRFNNTNLQKGEKLNLHLKKGMIELANVELKDQLLEIASVDFKDPTVFFSLNNPNRIPATTTLTPEEVVTTVDNFLESVDTLQGWTFKINDMNLERGYFQVDNNRWEERKDGELDVNHLKLHDIKISAEDFLFAEDTAYFDLKGLQFREGKGFVLKRLAATDSRVTRSSLQFYDMELVTPDSYLGDSLLFTYPHISYWGDFVNTVRMDLRFHGATVAIKDILFWAPILKKNKFFKVNENEEVLIEGRVYDRVNQLKSKDLSLKIGKNSYVEGDFAFFNLVQGDEAALNATVDLARTNMKNLTLLFPFVKIPQQFQKLGNLTFSGKFGGFLRNFGADGILKTNLGTAKTSIHMDLSGPKGGSYDGELELINFDLGEWLDNDDFDKISFSASLEGSGFTIDNVTIDTINGKVTSFAFKDYTYEDIGISGRFDKRLFAGNLVANDDNIALNFDGTVNFNDSLPKFDLYTNIQRLDLRPLNLLNKDYVLNGGVELKFVGDHPNNLAGYGVLRNFELRTQGEKHYVDSLRIESRYRPEVQERTYVVNSELLSGQLISNFDIVRTKDLLLRFFANNYPAFAEKFEVDKYISKDSLNVVLANAGKNEFFKFNLNVVETRNLLSLIDTSIYEIKDLDVKGRFDSELDRFQFNIDIPQFRFANVKINNVNVKLRAEEDQCFMYAKDLETEIGDSLLIPDITINNRLNGDTLSFEIDGGKVGSDILNTLRLRGQFFPFEEFFQVTLSSTSLNIYNKEWDIKGDNYIRFNKKVLQTRNLHFTNKTGEEALLLNSFGKRGMQVDIENISLDWMDDFVTLKQFDFDGNFFAGIKIGDVFKAEDFSGNARIEHFKVNERDWGTLNFKRLKLKNPRSAIEGVIELKTDKNERLYVAGKYNLPGVVSSRPPNYFSMRLDTKNFPVNIAEYFIGHSVSNTTGTFAANILITGTPKEPNLKGKIKVRDASTTVDYLQTRYFIDYALVDVRKDGFYLGGRTLEELSGRKIKGTIVRDENGNTAFAAGGILHDYLRNLRFDIVMDADNFLVLNTEKEDNELFYGKAIGDIHMTVTGVLARPDLKISGTSKPETRIVLPLTYEQKANEVTFIEFQKRDSLGNFIPDTTDLERKIRAPIGVSVEMDLDITPDAEILMIFNEQTGDIIRGNGKGNLTIKLERGEDLEMYGQYVIEEGEYLFTYQNLINKPFAVKKGGTIDWDGDPYNAIINLDAYYKNLTVPPYNFIVEYLRTDEEQTIAKRTTEVELLMNLTGDLFKPDIIFDLDFPNVDQRIKSYTDAKLRLVKADKNELNRQVFALIVLGNFFSYDESIASNFVSTTSINTLTEMLSNQLSVYLTDLLSEVVGDVGVISSIDFDVNYRYHQFSEGGSNPDDLLAQSGSEFQGGLRTGLLNDKLILNIEGNVGTSTINASGTYFAGDFEIEYLVTEDGRLRIRGYSRYEPNITGGNRSENGIGLSYQREFDTFKEFIDDMKINLKKNKEGADSDVGN